MSLSAAGLISARERSVEVCGNHPVQALRRDSAVTARPRLIAPVEPAWNVTATVMFSGLVGSMAGSGSSAVRHAAALCRLG
jgi:hypothetical protein